MRERDGQVLIFAPTGENAGMIARFLRHAGIACYVASDAASLASCLEDRSERWGAVVVTAVGASQGGDHAIAAFKGAEASWSALPIVLLAPRGSAVVPPWWHTTVVPQPTTSRQLVWVVRRALEERSHQYRLAKRSHDLQRFAYQDALTGLPNRFALYEKIRDLQEGRRGVAPTFAALFIDLDGFKDVNDTHGHLVGDEVLRQVGAHLVAAVRSTDYVGRWGGDEFLVLLVGAAGTDVVAETVRRLGRGVDLVLESSSERVHAAFSVGQVDDVAPGLSVDEILDSADARMYADKRERRRAGSH